MNSNVILINHLQQKRYTLRFPKHQFDIPYHQLLLEFLNLNLLDWEEEKECSLSKPFALLFENSTADLIQLQNHYQTCINQKDYGNLMQKDESFTGNYHLQKEGDSQRLCLAYEIHNLPHLLSFEALQLYVSEQPIKRCMNCNRYFIPANRADEKYCSYLDSGKKSCKQIGYHHTISKSNPFQYEYRKAYKTQYARIRYYSNIPNYKETYFDCWEKEAKEAKKQYETLADIEGFRQWLSEKKDTTKPKKDH